MYLHFKIFFRLRKTVLDNSNQTVSAANFKDLCDAMSRNKQNWEFVLNSQKVKLFSTIFINFQKSRYFYFIFTSSQNSLFFPKWKGKSVCLLGGILPFYLN